MNTMRPFLLGLVAMLGAAGVTQAQSGWSGDFDQGERYLQTIPRHEASFPWFSAAETLIELASETRMPPTAVVRELQAAMFTTEGLFLLKSKVDVQSGALMFDIEFQTDAYLTGSIVLRVYPESFPMKLGGLGDSCGA
ncbi:MAG: hypothetical protein K2R98_20315 [Gemmataceae bacterium]|nr:hypothetical protein [Gemmataceae bacterium]